MRWLEVRPETELDALEPALWYDGEREGLGAEFVAELRATFARVEEGPLREVRDEDVRRSRCSEN